MWCLLAHHALDEEAVLDEGVVVEHAAIAVAQLGRCGTRQHTQQQEGGEGQVQCLGGVVGVEAQEKDG